MTVQRQCNSIFSSSSRRYKYFHTRIQKKTKAGIYVNYRKFLLINNTEYINGYPTCCQVKSKKIWSRDYSVEMMSTKITVKRFAFPLNSLNMHQETESFTGYFIFPVCRDQGQLCSDDAHLRIYLNTFYMLLQCVFSIQFSNYF